MRPEVISEAINDISEEYKLEALELHDKEVVSDEINMGSHKASKKVVGIGIAVGLTLAFGVTAYATDLFGIRQHDVEPDETIAVKYELEDEAGETYVDVISYDNIGKCLFFEGPATCEKVEFKANFLPEGCECTFPEEMNMTGWNDYNLQVLDAEGYVINIEVHYSAEFGTDGCMFFEESFTNTEETTIGEYDALKMTGFCEYILEEPAPGEASSYRDDNCYVILENSEGCIFVISGQNMDELVKIAEGLETRKTGETIDYDPNAEHNLYTGNGVG